MAGRGAGGSRAGGRFAPWPTAPFCLTACRLVAGSSPNITEPERRGDPGQREPEAREGEAVSGPDYEEDEEYEEALPVHQYIVDDLIRGESASRQGPGVRWAPQLGGAGGSPVAGTDFSLTSLSHKAAALSW